MKNKTWLTIGTILAALSILAALASLIFTLPDWVLRTAGIVMMIALVVVVYNSVKIKQEKKGD